MNLRRTPRAATWVLKQFGTQPEDETVIGDLTEQYQRGQGSIWYWRQVLSIVFGTLLRTARDNKWNFFTGLFRTVLVWIGLRFMPGILLLLIDLFRQLAVSQGGFNTVGAIDGSMRYQVGAPFPVQGPVPIALLTIALRVLALLAVGRYCSRYAKVNPNSMLLAFVATFAIVNFGVIAIGTVFIGSYGSLAAALFMIQGSISLIVSCALILFGGMRGQRGLSPV
jgi:hypothetical protein